MKRMGVLVLVLWLAPSRAASAQTVIADQLIAGDTGPYSIPDDGQYHDIPGTAKQVSVPAGKALLVWTIQGGGFIRPAIGEQAQSEQRFFSNPAVGSWVTVLTPGTYDVRLQYKGDGSLVSFSGASWTLVVFPVGNAPAVNGMGLIVLAAGIIAAAWHVIRRRKLTGPDAAALMLVLASEVNAQPGQVASYHVEGSGAGDVIIVPTVPASGFVMTDLVVVNLTANTFIQDTAGSRVVKLRLVGSIGATQSFSSRVLVTPGPAFVVQGDGGGLDLTVMGYIPSSYGQRPGCRRLSR